MDPLSLSIKDTVGVQSRAKQKRPRDIGGIAAERNAEYPE